MKKKSEFSCMWTQQCEYKHKCCSFCNRKSCEWRCCDDLSKCKFKTRDSEALDTPNFNEETICEVRVRVHNVKTDRSVVEKLIKYKKSNKLKTCDLSERIGVNEATLNKLMRDPVSKIRSDSYEKVKDFIREIKMVSKSSLW